MKSYSRSGGTGTSQNLPEFTGRIDRSFRPLSKDSIGPSFRDKLVCLEGSLVRIL